MTALTDMAEIKVIKTAAEQGLAEAYAGARETLPGAGSVKSLREDAFQTFEAQGLPHRRVEEWKYTDLRALMRDAKPLAPLPDAAAETRAMSAAAYLATVAARRIVIVDGVYSAGLSDLADLETGLSIGSLAQALAAGDAGVIERLSRPSAMAQDPAYALNTAMMSDGVVISVADGAAVERPIHLVFVTTQGRPVSVFTRTLVTIGQAAKASLIESHESGDGFEHQVNHALDLSVADKARFDHVKIGRDGDRTLHVATLIAQIGADAYVNDFTFTAGSAVTRYDVTIGYALDDIAAGRWVHERLLRMPDARELAFRVGK